MDWGVVIPEETTPVRIELFRQWIKLINQDKFALISISL